SSRTEREIAPRVPALHVEFPYHPKMRDAGCGRKEKLRRNSAIRVWLKAGAMASEPVQGLWPVGQDRAKGPKDGRVFRASEVSRNGQVKLHESRDPTTTPIRRKV